MVHYLYNADLEAGSFSFIFCFFFVVVVRALRFDGDAASTAHRTDIFGPSRTH